MGITYRFDVLSALKDRGYSSYRLRKEKILSESVIQSFRVGGPVSLDNIAKICELLNCQPGDILLYEDSNR